MMQATKGFSVSDWRKSFTVEFRGEEGTTSVHTGTDMHVLSLSLSLSLSHTRTHTHTHTHSTGLGWCE